MRKRIEQEVALLRKFYPDIEHREHGGEDWFRIPLYPFPSGWRINDAAMNEAPIAFKIGVTHPTGEPYAFATPTGINFNGTPPNNSGQCNGIPFEGSWHQFSWAPDGWVPTSELNRGSNLLMWAQSFVKRLKEGA